MQTQKIFMKNIARLSALLLSLACLGPAMAADAVYPPGLRIGLEPLQGLVVSKTFPGFETEDQRVKVLVTELPPAAYAEVENAFNTKSFPGGANAIKPERLPTGAGDGFYTVESAKDGAEPVRRFSMIISGGSNALRIIASTPRDDWSKSFARFRAVRDGIQPR